MLRQIDRVLRSLYRICGDLAAMFVVLIAVLVLVNIISRQLGVFVPGMTEGAGYCMAAAGALGLAYTFGEHGHIRVTMLIGKLRGKIHYLMELWALFVAVGLSAYVSYFLLRMVYFSHLFEERSDGFGALLIWIPQVPTALGFTVFAVALGHALVAGLCGGTINDANIGGPDMQRTGGG